MEPPELQASPQWQRTGHDRFPVAAAVDGKWWVMRMNIFPDHSRWTLFIDGVARYDIDSTPPTWGNPADPAAPKLDNADEVLEPVKNLVTYGSEVGQPCDNPFCCG
ncbi:hypothetical protein LWC34_34520 [Kibdelosporangium philippinense]|uniref:Uncharacterized protein n=1 Tax=Kibdelosporangium philippinense TaxID=211113 RepID=A0ABS8ZKC9_9PSEU|nr:hypothetical protein [Kibdelosporangium philippinense]MCE7007899.1 hypothetical protein [Kibdelosporangium philippinense]